MNNFNILILFDIFNLIYLIFSLLYNYNYLILFFKS